MISANYILPLCSFGRADNYLSSAQGSLADHNLTLPEILHGLRAQENCTLIPSHLFDRSDFHEVLASLKSFHQAHIAISAPSEVQSLQNFIIELERNGFKIDILFQESEDLTKISEQFPKIFHSHQVRWIFLANKVQDFVEAFTEIPEVIHSRLCVGFLDQTDPQDIYLPLEQMISYEAYLRKQENPDIIRIPLISLQFIHSPSQGQAYGKSENSWLKFFLLICTRNFVRLIHSPKVFIQTLFHLYLGRAFHRLTGFFLRSLDICRGTLIKWARKMSSLFIFGILKRLQRTLLFFYYHRMTLLWPFYKAYWILQARLSKTREDHGRK